MKPREFIASLSYDIRLAPYDIQGSIAHAKMLSKCRIISTAEASKIIRGLESIAKSIQAGKRLPQEEDIHMAIERELIRRIGPVGGKLHTARSRNDQIALDLRLYLKDYSLKKIELLKEFQRVIISLARRNFGVIFPGFTHLQHGQPVLFSHHLLAYGWMAERDKERLRDTACHMDELPLGAGALAGTSFPIDRAYTAKLLGFSRICQNSIDAVSDRDFVIEFLSNCAITMAHLSRLAEELVIWSSPEFAFVELAEEFTSGSSMMPQKRNPDTAEILRGKTGRVFGNLMAALTLMKGQPLAYNRDLQEDKPPLFDSADTVGACIGLMILILDNLKINKKRMREACQQGYVAATELADYLSRKGVPFRTAHGIVREMVRGCLRAGIAFEDLTLEELQRFSPKFEEDVLQLLDPEKVVEAKTSWGGTSPKMVQRQIRELEALTR